MARRKKRSPQEIVANAQLLSAVSGQLGVSPSTVSRRIEALEVALRVKLFRPSP